MHTLVRLGLAGGAVAAGTGAAIALVLGQRPRPVTPTPSAPATESVAPDAYSPSNPTPTCPDGSSVFVYGRTDAAAGARYQAVGFRNCGRPETLRLDQLPDMAVTNRDGTLGAPVVTRQLRAYLADPGFVFSLPLRSSGTAFQRRVWGEIAAIPCHQTKSYGELAKALHNAPRAVGQACGANPFPLIVPCHRVIASGGGLGGFARQRGGFLLDVKRWLLAHEGH